MNRRTFLQTVGAAAAWSPLQAKLIPWQGPVSSVLHPNGRFLYAANAESLHENLPRGTVDVFSVHRHNGLRFMQRQALSLSGTEPRSLAITPDGRYLLIALYGGGAYNVLPIEPTGMLGPVKGIFKELGRGEHAEHQASAHPHTLLLDSKGRFVIASDFGCDRISVFAVDENGNLQRKSKVSVASGAGPGAMALDADGSTLYVWHELKPGVSCHRYDASEGILEEHYRSIELNALLETPPRHFIDQR